MRVATSSRVDCRRAESARNCSLVALSFFFRPFEFSHVLSSSEHPDRLATFIAHNMATRMKNPLLSVRS